MSMLGTSRAATKGTEHGPNRRRERTAWVRDTDVTPPGGPCGCRCHRGRDPEQGPAAWCLCDNADATLCTLPQD